MERLMAIVGAFHVFAYAIAGLMLAAGTFTDWAIRRAGLQKEIIRAYGRVLADRRAAREGKENGQ